MLRGGGELAAAEVGHRRAQQCLDGARPRALLAVCKHGGRQRDGPAQRGQLGMPNADEAALAQQAQVRHDVRRRRRLCSRFTGLGSRMTARLRFLMHSL